MLYYKGKRVKGVIFDMDGTIIDSLSMYLECLNTQLEEAGLQPVSREFLFKHLGMGVPLRDILLKIVPNNDGDLVETMADSILREFWGVDAEIALLPGVTKTFEYLKKNGAKIGLATGRTSGLSYEWEKFKRVGLGHFIDAIVTSSDIGKRKPAPDIVLRCAEVLGLGPQDCIVVGDAVADMVAARHAESTAIGVCSGVDSRSKLKEASAETVMERLDHLIQLLNEDTS